MYVAMCACLVYVCMYIIVLWFRVRSIPLCCCALSPCVITVNTCVVLYLIMTIRYVSLHTYTYMSVIHCTHMHPLTFLPLSSPLRLAQNYYMDLEKVSGWVCECSETGWPGKGCGLNRLIRSFSVM